MTKKKPKKILPESQELLAHMLLDGEDIRILFRAMERHGLHLFTCGSGKGEDRFVVCLARGKAADVLAAGSVAIGREIDEAKKRGDLK